jgi:hypothetical protein
VAAARRAEALRAVLVRDELLARRVLVLVERLVPFERERVVLVLRRALLRLVFPVFCVAMVVAIPPPGVSCSR